MKDLRAYYFKPPNISWGILFPLVLTLAFLLRDPTGLVFLAPGLIAMTAVFGTTSMEAIVITFERRNGALERLLLAPISIRSLLIGKVLGGAVFGGMISGVMMLVTITMFDMAIIDPLLFSVALVLTLLTLSALGALVAVSVKEVFEAQTLSNFFRFPMIFLCGVFIPVQAMPVLLQVVAYFLPLTYSVNALRMATLEVSELLASFSNIGALMIFLFLLLGASEWVLKRSME
ncbi:MAG: ABC transporter permease [Promethearchaeota archaeon]